MKELGHILFKFVDPIPSTEPQPVPTQPMERFVELSKYSELGLSSCLGLA